jgi:hypothetical protein
MIGCEPFLNGVASALRHIEEGGLKNVRLHADDARDVMTALPDASLDRVMILFPDPWHKARHNKRRLVQARRRRRSRACSSPAAACASSPTGPSTPTGRANWSPPAACFAAPSAIRPFRRRIT